MCESVEMIIWNLNTQDEEVAAENLDLHYVSSPTGRSYSPSRKMHDLGEALPDTVSTNNFFSQGILLLSVYLNPSYDIQSCMRYNTYYTNTAYNK